MGKTSYTNGRKVPYIYEKLHMEIDDFCVKSVSELNFRAMKYVSFWKSGTMKSDSIQKP